MRTHVALEGYVAKNIDLTPTVCGLWVDERFLGSEEETTCQHCKRVVLGVSPKVIPSAAVREGEERRDDHAYTSTACRHKLHEECRLQCKFCGAPCRCDCHAPPGTFQGEWEE